MRTEQFQLSDDGRVTITAYLLEESKEMTNWDKRPAVLVLPGGAYLMTSDREADPVALYYLSQGFHTFVLRYSVAEHGVFPAQLIDASKAMQLIRQHAEEWHLDGERLAVCGFSAGGHLAASLGTMWNDEELITGTGIEYGMNKPNAIILGYPVITCGNDTQNHLQGMWNAASGNNLTEEVKHRLSCERHVGEHTPPAFIFHTFMDNVVPVENALLFGQALAKHNVPFEMHIYPNGVHGLSLANEVTSTGRGNLVDEDAAGWIELSSKWLWRLFAMKQQTNEQEEKLERAQLLE